MKMYHIQSLSKILPLDIQGICSKRLTMNAFVFLLFNFKYPKKFEATFLLIQELFLCALDRCKVLSEV